MQREEKDLGFCTLYYKKNDPSVKNFYIKKIRKAYNINQKLFNKKIKEFDIVFLYSRREMNKIWGCKTPKFMPAFGWKNKIGIFSPSVIERTTCWKKSDFFATLTHEINHLFYQNITGTYKPVWLSEGIATYLQHKKEKKRKINLTSIKKRYKIKSTQPLLFEYDQKLYEKYPKFYYNQAFLAVNYLIKKYGKRKLLKLITNIPKNLKKKEFNIIFERLYKIPVIKLSEIIEKW